MMATIYEEDIHTESLLITRQFTSHIVQMCVLIWQLHIDVYNIPSQEYMTFALT